MAVDFPTSPTLGQVVSGSGVSWRWDGTTWVLTGPSDPGATPWIAPTLTGGWVNYGGGYSTAGYRKIGDIVYLRGLIKSGTLLSAAFTLPVGYRVPGTEHFPVTANDAMGSCRVQSDGAVVPTAGSTTWFALDVIQFSVTP